MTEYRIGARYAPSMHLQGNLGRWIRKTRTEIKSAKTQFALMPRAATVVSPARFVGGHLISPLNQHYSDQ